MRLPDSLFYTLMYIYIYVGVLLIDTYIFEYDDKQYE